MAFSVAQYEAVTHKLVSGTDHVAQKIPELAAATNDLLGKWYVPGFVKDAVKWLVEKIISLAEWLLDKIIELMKGAVAPVYLFGYAWDWQDIKGAATGVASELTPQTAGIDQDWKGATADAYGKAIQPQAAAAAQIGSISNQTAISLTLCASAGLAFYVALLAIVIEFIIQLVAAIAAVGSIIFSWAGLAMVAADCGASAGMIWATVALLSACLTAQASQMAALHGQAVDETSFPGGHWPQAVLS